MKAFFLVGAVQALFLAILILSKRNKSLPDFVLVALLSFVSLPLFYYYFNYEATITDLMADTSFPNFYFFINAPLTMTFAPMVYLYIKSHFVPPKKFVQRNIIHLLPTITFILLSLLFVDFHEVKEKGFFVINPVLRYIFLSFIPLITLLMIFYVINSFKLLRLHSQHIRDHFSDLENADLNWLRNFLIITTILWVLFVPAGAVLIRQGKLIIVYQMVLAILSLSVFFIAFFGFYQSSVFMIANIKNGDERKYENSQTDDTAVEDVSADAAKLKEFMAVHKPYLEYKLSLSQLATKLGWSTTHLSYVLNKELKQNFYEFVNHYRVEEVKKLLKSDTKYTNLGIAFDCGFNSKSSFHRIFKEVTGLTPSEYKKSLNIS
jgi:AraC-like DNA-binding protein